MVELLPSMLRHGLNLLLRWLLVTVIILCRSELLPFPFPVNASASCNSFSSNSLSCNDLNGVGSFNTTCFIKSHTLLSTDFLCIYGSGNLHLSPGTNFTCPIYGCQISVQLSGNIEIGAQASVTAGSIIFNATNILLNYKSLVDASALGGGPPAQTSGTPPCCEKAGGGHGGRGASCLQLNRTSWGGDVYAWSTLAEPWSYGSDGGGGGDAASSESPGHGGGRVALWANQSLAVDGFVLAQGGDGGTQGGGGSGGSIIIHAYKLTGNGTISAAGGSGWGGGGGGRISTECYSIQQDITISVHGGTSYGCPENAAGAGTLYDRSLQTLKVSNDNFTTRTETPLLGFPLSILWSNVLVEAGAQVLVPLLWTRVQVTGQIKLIDGGSICFGLSENPISEFELVAEELLMSDSVIKVYGAFRMYVKMLLMWDSKIKIEGGHNEDVRVSTLESRNLIVLKHNSVISSNADLVVYGQGLLNLSGLGDGIKAHRLFLSLFYNILVGPGSFLQAPLDDAESNSEAQLPCESQTCPNELIMPPDDCHVNISLSFTLQICRVEDLIVSGIVKGSVIHIHRARTVTIYRDGIMSASELGCKEGMGKGKRVGNGAGGGAGHGGKGGCGFYNGLSVDGGSAYGDADLPCELGSGTSRSSSSGGSEKERVAGGGMIVVGSMKWPLSKLEIHGSLSADGQSPLPLSSNATGGGAGGASGGTLLLFLQYLLLQEKSYLSAAGGSGGLYGGGGGGGGRVHFHWSNIATGDEYVQIASVNGTILSSGGRGNAGGQDGENGSITGKKCPKGLYGTFCHECPIGTYKDVVGSSFSLCLPCSLHSLPYRADFIYVRGGATQPSCPYKCLSDKYKMPHCYTPIEDIISIFGGPWTFAILLSFLLVLLAFLITALRIKMGENNNNNNNYPNPVKGAMGSDGHAYLLSLAEVAGTSKAEETQSHVHRLYFMGPNTFREPWHLPYSPPDAIIGIVYEDTFNHFIDEINQVAAYQWWEGSVHSILSVVAYPCAWSWKQWCRRKKIQRLQEYVKTEYDHSCLRSCRSRALYKGMKVGSTADLMVAYIDFFLGGDEKKLDVVSSIQKRFPMCIIFGGDGSYMCPYNLHSDSLLSNIVGQYVSTAIWKRFVTGLNGQLRTVRQRRMRRALGPVLLWIRSHGNPQLERYGVNVNVGWFQATASGYYQLGIVVSVNEVFFFTSLSSPQMPESSSSSSSSDHRSSLATVSRQLLPFNQTQTQTQTPPQSISAKKRVTGGVHGGIINEGTLDCLHYRRDYLFPFSLLLQNTRPIGFHQTLELAVCTLLLADFTITLLMLLHFYWISVGAFLVILLIPPLSLLSPFLAGLNAIFSRAPKKSSLSRIYALWNVTSFLNIIVAIICGLVFCLLYPSRLATLTNNSILKRDGNEWWVLPLILFLVKAVQELLVNWHIANVEISDMSLYTPDPDKFWAM